MTNNEYLTDDYVADLLAKDAKDCSLKYSAMGLEAFRSDSKKPANMPKPNTRFLRHIIKDTDTHNKNLLAREAAESKARLKDLEHTEEVKRLRMNPNARDIRKRQMGDIHAILGGKRQRKDDGKKSSSRKRDDKEGEASTKDRSRSSRKDRDLFNDRDGLRHHGRLDGDRDDELKIRGRSERSSRHKRDDRSSSDDEHSRRRSHRGRRRDRSRSRSPRRRRRSRSPDGRARNKSHRERSSVRKPTRLSPSRETTSAADDDSDPLDDLIGPLPAPKPRGRGAVAGSSGIDRRFSETYDPKMDVDMDGDGAGPTGGGWDDAVEAFRDHQKLKQAQEARMKLAGFTDGEIQRAKGTTEELRAEDHFTWSKAGEKREWDKDKDDE